MRQTCHFDFFSRRSLRRHHKRAQILFSRIRARRSADTAGRSDIARRIACRARRHASTLRALTSPIGCAQRFSSLIVHQLAPFPLSFSPFSACSGFRRVIATVASGMPRHMMRRHYFRARPRVAAPRQFFKDMPAMWGHADHAACFLARATSAHEAALRASARARCADMRGGKCWFSLIFPRCHTYFSSFNCLLSTMPFRHYRMKHFIVASPSPPRKARRHRCPHKLSLLRQFLRWAKENEYLSHSAARDGGSRYET